MKLKLVFIRFLIIGITVTLVFSADDKVYKFAEIPEIPGQENRPKSYGLCRCKTKEGCESLKVNYASGEKLAWETKSLDDPFKCCPGSRLPAKISNYGGNDFKSSFATDGNALGKYMETNKLVKIKRDDSINAPYVYTVGDETKSISIPVNQCFTFDEGEIFPILKITGDVKGISGNEKVTLKLTKERIVEETIESNSNFTFLVPQNNQYSITVDAPSNYSCDDIKIDIDGATLPEKKLTIECHEKAKLKSWHIPLIVAVCGLAYYIFITRSGYATHTAVSSNLTEPENPVTKATPTAKNRKAPPTKNPLPSSQESNVASTNDEITKSNSEVEDSQRSSKNTTSMTDLSTSIQQQSSMTSSGKNETDYTDYSNSTPHATTEEDTTS